MKINSIYISAFGKLHDYTLDLSDGFNVIYGENENGKSTVMAFIRMMFYGSGGRKSQQIASNPRLKYLPWSGAGMGGRINFEHSGHRYCLEREFKKSDSTDRIRLTDIDLGTEIATDSNVGLQFFGLGVDAFERSMFVGAIEPLGSNEKADGELSSKLSNMVLTGDEDTSYQTVVSRLDNARYALVSKSGRTGSLVKGADELRELNEQIRLCEERETERGELSARASRLREELKSADSRQKEFKLTLEREHDIKSAEKLREYLDKKQELTELSSSLTLKDGSPLDEMFVKKLSFCLTKVENEKSGVENLRAGLKRQEEQIRLSENENTNDTKESLAKEQTRLEGLNARKSALEKETLSVKATLDEAQSAAEALKPTRLPFNVPLIIIGIILLIAGIIVPVDILNYILMAAGPVLIILSVVLGLIKLKNTANVRNKFEAVKQKYDELISEAKSTDSEILQSQNNITFLSSVINLAERGKEGRERELSQVKSMLSDAEKRLSAANDDLLALTERIDGADPENIASLMPELEDKAQKQKELKLRLGYLSSDLGGISYEDAAEKLSHIEQSCGDTTDFDLARNEYEALAGEIATLSTELTEVLTRLKTGFSGGKNPEILRQKVTELEAALDNKKLFYDAAEIALYELNESFAEVRRGYGSALENKTLDIFSRLTGGRYGAMGISKSMEITVEETGVFGTRELDYLSSGTADQAYLSLRLAMSHLISEEPMPVMLDDVLCQYDDSRTLKATEFLNEYSLDRQTLLFTCHKSVCDAAEKSGAQIKVL